MQLMQLLKPDCYPENDAANLAAQTRARVLILVKTVSRARMNIASRQTASPPVVVATPSSHVAPPALSDAGAQAPRVAAGSRSSFLARLVASLTWLGGVRMTVPRRLMLLMMVLLALLLFHRRGNILRAVELLRLYRRLG